LHPKSEYPVSNIHYPKAANYRQTRNYLEIAAKMSEEVDRNDPELKYLSVERNQFNDPATQAEWTQKRLVWVPHENQVSLLKCNAYP